MAARDLNCIWPPLQLTEFESQHVGHYAGVRRDGKMYPGVFRRAYPLTLTKVANLPGEANQLVASFAPSGRYTRVFALTFSGDVMWWNLKLRTNPGEVLFDTSLVSTLVNNQNSGAAATAPPTLRFFGVTFTAQAVPPLVFEPNVVLPGNANLVFEGDVVPAWDFYAQNPPIPPVPPFPPYPSRAVLHILVHVWEFPDVLGAMMGPKAPQMPVGGENMRRGRNGAR